MAKNRSTAAPTAPPVAAPADTEERYLLGPQHLQELLDQVASLGTTGPRTTRSALSDRWRAAAQEYERLASSKQGTFAMQRIATVADIYPVFRELFRRRA